MALVGGIMAAAGFGQYAGTLKGLMTIILFIFLNGIFAYFILILFLLDATILTIGFVMAIAGGALLLFLKINEQFLEGGI
ncbi:MAG: hypothetical protein ACTSO9_07480 [Candidatus Helarchaeota archaeon]